MLWRDSLAGRGSIAGFTTGLALRFWCLVFFAIFLLARAVWHFIPVLVRVNFIWPAQLFQELVGPRGIDMVVHTQVVVFLRLTRMCCHR